MKMVYCACGCGKTLTERFYRDKGKMIQTRFIRGHNSNVKINFKQIGLTGEEHPSWRGGTCKHSKGYILIWKKDHPYCDVRGYVPEHRLIIEKNLGRYLTKEEDVHHINGNKKDNRLENLELLSHGEHSRRTNSKSAWTDEYEC
jgi:uncharacterized protein (DUF1330 family)